MSFKHQNNIYHYLCFLTLLLLSACHFQASSSKDEDVQKFTSIKGSVFGTTYEVKIFKEQIDQSQYRGIIDSELKRLDLVYNHYVESSELSQFNKSQSLDPLTISFDLMQVLTFAKQVNKMSNGAFDISLGPLVNLWGFGPDKSRRDKMPTKEEVEQLRSFVGNHFWSMRKEHIKGQKTYFLKKDHALLHLDLSALAKGHAVDSVYELLVQKLPQTTPVYVEIGGEIRVGSSYKKMQGQKNFRIAIEGLNLNLSQANIDSSLNTPKVLSLHEGALATSGSYKNFVIHDKKHFSHTFNIKSMSPIENRNIQASVVLPNCMSADAWATAFMAMAQEDAFDLAKLYKIPLLMVYQDKMSKKIVQRSNEFFKAYLVQL